MQMHKETGLKTSSTTTSDKETGLKTLSTTTSETKISLHCFNTSVLPDVLLVL